MKKLRKRVFAVALAALMLVTAMPVTALYASAEIESVSGNAIGPPTGPLEEDTVKCICETLCTEYSINEDCLVCSAEGSDLSSCKGEKTEVQEATGEKVITAWEWIDPEEYLTDGMLALPGAGRENPAFMEDVTALLPEKIQAKVAAVNVAEDGEETEEDTEAAPETEDAEITLAGWECASYPEDGAYEGTYTFTASLPGGFVLAEDAAALEVEVELGGAKMLDGEVSVAYEGKVLTYNGDTQTTTFSADDTITVKAAPTATGTTPQKAAARLRSDYTAPVAGEMALFVGDVQVSEPVVAGVDGIYTMTVSASDVLTLGGVEPNGDPITLTAKFVGNDNTADVAGTVDVNISAVARAEMDGTVIGYYDASSLAAAFIDSSNSGVTFTLLADVEGDYFNIENDCTLDLNGHNIHTELFLGIQYGYAVTIRGQGQVISTGYKYSLGVGGTLTLEGGTFIGGSNWGSCGVWVGQNGVLNVTGKDVVMRDYYESCGLEVNADSSVRLSVGTYKGATAIRITGNSSKTLANLLGTDGSYAYYGEDGKPIALSELEGQTELAGPVTVKECNHIGGLTPSGNGYQHGGACLCCGTDLPLEEHTLGTDGKCTVCGAELVAQVNDTCYTDFQSAWSAAQIAGTATVVTLLTDVNLENQCITLSAGNITLTGSGRTLTGGGRQTIEVTGGELIVENVTVKNTNSESHTNSGIHVLSGKTAKVTVGENATVTGSTGIYQESGSLVVSGTVEGTNGSGFGVLAHGVALIVEEGAKISGGNEGIRHTMGGSLTINGGTINGRIAGVQITEDVTAKLNGGTFTGVYDAVAINGSVTITMGNLLSTGYAIFKDDGTAVERTETSTGPGTFTVKECQHTGVEAADQGGGKHGLACPYCGYSCSHDTILTATTSDNVITVNKGCETEGCGYSEKLGTVSFTFENLVYRDSEAMVSWTKDGPAASGVVLKIDNADDYAIQCEDTAYSCSLTDLFGSTPVTAGDYTLKVLFYDDSIIGGKDVECELPFTVAPATLTENMVTLDKTEVTYNGAEQKPTLTVKHGQTVLTERTEYDVSYTRDDAATTDFTSAGTVKITVTGKGNYDKTVIKEFTISKADVPEIALTYTAPDDLVCTGQPKTVTVTANNLTGLGEITVKYKKDNKGDFLTEAVEPGTYSVYAVISEGENYNSAEIEMGQFTISYITAPTVLYYNGGERKEWYSGDVDVSAGGIGYTVSDTVGGDYGNSYTICAQQGTVTKILYFKDGDGHISNGVDVTVNFDLTPPTGEIAVGAKWWQNLLHFVSFGNYAAKEYTVSIKTEDEGGSGIDNDKIEYVIVTGSSQYTDANALAAANLSWTAYNDSFKPTIPADSSPYVVYARLTDKVGNVAYISTDGVLLDSTAPTVDGLTVPGETIRDVTAGVTFTVDEAADYYYVVLPKDSAAPSAEDIIVTCGGTLPDGKTGTTIADATSKGSGAVSGNTLLASVSVEAENLQPNTAYIVYVTAVDRAVDITDSAEGIPAGNIGAVEASAEFTTEKALPVIMKAPTVTGTYGHSVGEMTVAGGVAQDGDAVLTGTWTVSGTDKDRKPSAGTAEKVTVIFAPDSDKYDSVSVQAPLKVAPRDLNAAGVTVSDVAGTYIYTGSEIKPPVAAKAETPTSGIYISDSGAALTTNDFTVSYSDNKNAGTAFVIITGKGNYTGSVTRTFTIEKAPGRTIPDLTGSYADNGETYIYTITPIDGAVYRMGDSGKWTTPGAAAGNVFEGIKPGTSVTFYAKMPETENYEEGTPKSITVDFPKLTVKTPVISPAGGSYSGSEGGTVSFAFTHASDYVTAIDGDVPESPKTGQENENVLWPIVAGIIFLLGAVLAGMSAWKKKEENK